MHCVQPKFYRAHGTRLWQSDRFGLFLVLVLCTLRCDALAAEQPGLLRVLSYNIHHGEGVDGKLDLERIARVILSVEPDLVALHEVDSRTERTLFVDQPAELASLTNMQVVFGDNIPYQGGRYGNAVLSRFPIIRTENHALRSFYPGEQRGVLEVEVQLPNNQPSLLLFATHLDYRVESPERLVSASQINELIASRGDRPALLLGDLNAVPGSGAMLELNKQWRRTNRRTLPTYISDTECKQIDYIMFRPAKRWRVIETRVLRETIASDHRPILAVLSLCPLNR